MCSYASWNVDKFGFTQIRRCSRLPSTWIADRDAPGRRIHSATAGAAFRIDDQQFAAVRFVRQAERIIVGPDPEQAVHGTLSVFMMQRSRSRTGRPIWFALFSAAADGPDSPVGQTVEQATQFTPAIAPPEGERGLQQARAVVVLPRTWLGQADTHNWHPVQCFRERPESERSRRRLSGCSRAGRPLAVEVGKPGLGGLVAASAGTLSMLMPRTRNERRREIEDVRKSWLGAMRSLEARA